MNTFESNLLRAELAQLRKDLKTLQQQAAALQNQASLMTTIVAALLTAEHDGRRVVPQAEIDAAFDRCAFRVMVRPDDTDGMDVRLQDLEGEEREAFERAKAATAAGITNLREFEKFKAKSEPGGGASPPGS